LFGGPYLIGITYGTWLHQILVLAQGAVWISLLGYVCFRAIAPKQPLLERLLHLGFAFVFWFSMMAIWPEVLRQLMGIPFNTDQLTFPFVLVLGEFRVMY